MVDGEVLPADASGEEGLHVPIAATAGPTGSAVATTCSAEAVGGTLMADDRKTLLGKSSSVGLGEEGDLFVRRRYVGERLGALVCGTGPMGPG